MDTLFDPAQWKPTHPHTIQDFLPDIPHLSAQLAVQTQSLRRSPYNPQLWLDRARTLSALQYPELAVTDAYKAELLCQSALALFEKTETRRLGHQCGFWMEDAAVLDEQTRDCFTERYTRLQSESFRVQSENLLHWPSKDGGEWAPQPYPWMEERHLHRSDDLIALINEEFVANANAGVGRSHCELRRHAFGRSQTDPSISSDMLGVFAQHDIPKGASILHESTRLFGCDGPGHDAYLALGRCHATCTDPLHPNHPDDETHQDLRWIRDVLTRQHTAQVMLGSRMLLTSIQDRGTHTNPLDHHLIARLTPKYSTTNFLPFSLEEHVRVPNQILRQFGVDVFANPPFDGWVLFTIDARHSNNAWSNPMHSGIHPLFSMFNHSCEPNAEWETQEEPTEIKINALRDIKKGEQLFICYDGYIEKKTVEERRERLKTWLTATVSVRDVSERQTSAGTVHSRLMLSPYGMWNLVSCPKMP